MSAPDYYQSPKPGESEPVVYLQPPLPGIGELELSILRYAAHEYHAREAEAAEAEELRYMGALQDLAWAQYREEKLPEREQLWNTLIEPLYGMEPSMSFGEEIVRGEWSFAATRGKGEAQVLLTTSLRVTARHEDLPEEVLLAARYLQAPWSGPECPTELLGVRASGRAKKRTLPTLALHLACLPKLAIATLDSAQRIGIDVQASMPAFAAAKPISISGTALDTDWRRLQVRPLFLGSKDAYFVRNAFKEHYGDGWPMTNKALGDFLYAKAGSEDANRTRTVLEILALIDESAPATPAKVTAQGAR